TASSRKHLSTTRNTWQYIKTKVEITTAMIDRLTTPKSSPSRATATGSETLRSTHCQGEPTGRQTNHQPSSGRLFEERARPGFRRASTSVDFADVSARAGRGVGGCGRVQVVDPAVPSGANTTPRCQLIRTVKKLA